MAILIQLKFPILRSQLIHLAFFNEFAVNRYEYLSPNIDCYLEQGALWLRMLNLAQTDRSFASKFNS